jgi:hypothetical protein
MRATAIKAVNLSSNGKANRAQSLRRSALIAAVGLLALTFTSTAKAQWHHDDDDAFLPSPVRTVSTVPHNGDVNPYGVAFVPREFPQGGVLQQGDILVSNFNNAQNLQGTGTTIIRIPQTGSTSVFFTAAQGQQGLSTALNILKSGYVLVGSFPSLDGTSGTASAGSLLVLNSSGQLVKAISGVGIDGPWDMTVNDQGQFVQVFISNAISGTIIRLDFEVTSVGLTLKHNVEIASGYMHQGDPATFFDAPTGLVFDADSDTLFVASTLDNAVFAVHHAARAESNEGTGSIIYQDNTHLHGALAMTKAPNAHLLVSNNDVINADPNQPSEIVEFTTDGKFVKEISVDPNLGGSFGLSVAAHDDIARFAAVDDNAATLTIWTLQLP